MFRFTDTAGREIRLTPKTVVVKVGSNVICGGDGRLDARYISRLAETLCALMDRGVGIVLVSSGAIAAGLGQMRLERQSRSIPENQALAAVGQSRLMQVYGRAFGRNGRQVAQVLVTRADMEDRRRYLNSRRAIEALLAMGVIPIVNENDTTVFDEIQFGGNDVLSAIMATKLKADFLLLLTNVDGVYNENPECNPDAKLISTIGPDDDLGERVDTRGASPLGTGGMTSKISAARLATDAGVHAVIANGRGRGVLSRLGQGALSGTVFIANRDRRQSSWRHWLLSANRDRKCRLIVDGGARRALTAGKKSLLPAGVRGVEGDFQQGDVVDIVDDKGECFARGVANYSSDEATRIQGLRSDRIEKVLGYKLDTTVVHRDNLIVLD